MASQADVRRLALALPGAQQSSERFAFSVRNGAKDKGFAWVWMQRIDPRKPRVPCADVLAVRVANNDAKEIMLLAEPDKFFTEPHYNGFPAVLVRLAEIGVAELRALLQQAWAIQAPKSGAVRAAKKSPAASARVSRDEGKKTSARAKSSSGDKPPARSRARRAQKPRVG